MIEINGILRRLPHRYPFLLVDRIVEIEGRQRIVGIKNVTINEPFFPGHFPDNPVMPGVLILEAMAQTGAVLLLSEHDERMAGKYVSLAGVDKVRFRKPVGPGDRLRMELDVLSLKSRACKMAAKATVRDRLVAEAVLLSMLVDLNSGGSS